MTPDQLAAKFASWYAEQATYPSEEESFIAGYTACLRDSEGVARQDDPDLLETVARMLCKGPDDIVNYTHNGHQYVNYRMWQMVRDQRVKPVFAALRLAENKPITGGE